MSGIQSICLAAAIGSAMLTSALGQPVVPPVSGLPPVSGPGLPPISVPGLPPAGAPPVGAPPPEVPVAPDTEQPIEVPEMDTPDLPQAPMDAPSPATDDEMLKDLGFAVYKGMDYVPNNDPPLSETITDIGTGTVTESAVECAQECTANPACNALSYYGDLPAADWPGKKNCYIKTFSVCEMPVDAPEYEDDRYFLISETCVESAVAPGIAPSIAPAAAIGPAPPLGASPPLQRSIAPVGAPGPSPAAAPASVGSLSSPPLSPLAPGVSPDVGAASIVTSGAWIFTLAGIAAYVAM